VCACACVCVCERESERERERERESGFYIRTLFVRMYIMFTYRGTTHAVVPRIFWNQMHIHVYMCMGLYMCVCVCVCLLCVCVRERESVFGVCTCACRVLCWGVLVHVKATYVCHTRTCTCVCSVQKIKVGCIRVS